MGFNNHKSIKSWVSKLNIFERISDFIFYIHVESVDIFIETHFVFKSKVMSIYWQHKQLNRENKLRSNSLHSCMSIKIVSPVNLPVRGLQIMSLQPCTLIKYSSNQKQLNRHYKIIHISWHVQRRRRRRLRSKIF